jgi:hypothetical protein
VLCPTLNLIMHRVMASVGLTRDNHQTSFLVPFDSKSILFKSAESSWSSAKARLLLLGSSPMKR